LDGVLVGVGAGSLWPTTKWPLTFFLPSNQKYKSKYKK
jgi:hypothetical protein